MGRHRNDYCSDSGAPGLDSYCAQCCDRPRSTPTAKPITVSDGGGAQSSRVAGSIHREKNLA